MAASQSEIQPKPHHHHSVKFQSDDKEVDTSLHVKFNLQEDEIKNHHENLEIIKVNDYEFNINLGYLKIDHYYKLKFNIDLAHLLLANNQADTGSKQIVYLPHKSSKHITFKEIKRLDEKDGKQCVYLFNLVFHANKEKKDIETVHFSLKEFDSANGNGTENHHHHHHSHKHLVLNFEAKVLGAHQGTPLLRNGIVLLQNVNDHSPTDDQKSHFNIN